MAEIPEVLGTRNGILDVNLLVDPPTCLLGYVDFSLLKPPKQITVIHARFVARRQIARHPPTISD